MTEKDLYKQLSGLTKNRDEWETETPFVASLLSGHSVRIAAKALWLLGEMGLAFPSRVREHVPAIASFLSAEEPLLRQMSLNAMGRIGRGCPDSVITYIDNIFALASDADAAVRHAFIWACENIATSAPGIFEGRMQVFAELLGDHDVKVRREAPEMFRVMGRSMPDSVIPYAGRLRDIADNDDDHVVRIHSAGALKFL